MGSRSSVDLYAPAASVSEVVFRAEQGAAHPLSQRLIDFGTVLFFFLGLFAAALLRLPDPAPQSAQTRPGSSLPWPTRSSWRLFLFLKLDYPTFIAERVFRDTNSYLVQAEIPAHLAQFLGRRTILHPAARL